MSLLITSSRQAEFHDDLQVADNGLEQPNSYTNIMRSPLLVDADSEIAVVNIKCQRDGKIHVGIRGLTFGVYWGNELADGKFLNSYGELMAPRADSILSKNRVVYVKISKGVYTKKEFIDVLNDQVNKICGQTFSNFGGASVTGIYDATINLTGLSFEFKQNASATDVSSTLSAQDVITTSNHIPPDTLQDAGYLAEGNLPYLLTDDYVWTFANKRMTKGTDTTKDGCAVFSKPLSSTSGVCEVDFQNVSGNFKIGLTRGFSGGTMPCPLNFNAGTEEADQVGNGYTEFYDYVFQMDRSLNNPATVDNYNVAQSYFNSAYVEGELGTTTMSVLGNGSYAGGSPPPNASFEGVIGDDLRLCNIRFTRYGEKIKIEAFNKNADPSKVVTAILADFNLASLCPVNLANDQLYLKIDLAATADYVVINQFDSDATNTSDVGPNAPRNYGYDDIYTSSDIVREQVNHQNAIVDWDVNDAFASKQYNLPIVYVDAPTYQDFNASFGQDRKWVLVLDKDDNYQTWGIPNNVSAMLGFTKRIIKESVDKDASSTTNDIIFKGQRAGGLQLNSQFLSMFIRFHATQQQSYNANTGSISKIVYACPRFDVNGSLDGALYYEPNERVYIDMNNPSAITLTNMAIDIVDVNERLIENLEGQTQINFHIRKKSTGTART